MARNRQKAKERQARRKAQRGPGGGPGSGDGQEARPRAKPARPEPLPEPPLRDNGPEPELRDNGREEDRVVDPHLLAGAPPEDLGRSDEVLEHGQDRGADDEKEHFDSAEDIPEEDRVAGPRGHRASAERHKDRSRLVQFLFAVRAELQRVQWPDRQALTTLTGVVLGFVLIAGGYLGLLDAIVSRIVQAIL